MPSLTLKNVPPALHRALRERAVRHRRSLNSEAIACLEAAVMTRPLDVDDLLARARDARRRFHGTTRPSEVRKLIRDGRL